MYLIPLLLTHLQLTHMTCGVYDGLSSAPCTSFRNTVVVEVQGAPVSLALVGEGGLGRALDAICVPMSFQNQG